TIRRAWAWKRSGRSATTSAGESASCCTALTSPSRIDLHLHLLVAVPDAADGDDALGMTRVVLDLRPQPLHVHVERLRVAVVVRPPHAIDQHVTREHASGIGEEQLEQLELLQWECHSLPPHRHLMTRRVEPHVSDLEHLVCQRDAGVVVAPTP